MKKKRSVSSVEQIPLDKITVINPRARNRKVFEGIVKNIRPAWPQASDHCYPQDGR